MECRVYRLEYDTEEGPPSGVNSIKKGNKAGLRGKIDAGHQQGNGQDRWKGIKAGQFTAAGFVSGHSPTSAPALQQLQWLMEDAPFSDMDEDTDAEFHVSMMEEAIDWQVSVAAPPPQREMVSYCDFDDAIMERDIDDEDMVDTDPVDTIYNSLSVPLYGSASDDEMGEYVEEDDSDVEEGEIRNPKPAPSKLKFKLGFAAKPDTAGFTAPATQMVPPAAVDGDLSAGAVPASPVFTPVVSDSARIGKGICEDQASDEELEEGEIRATSALKPAQVLNTKFKLGVKFADLGKTKPAAMKPLVEGELKNSVKISALPAVPAVVQVVDVLSAGKTTPAAPAVEVPLSTELPLKVPNVFGFAMNGDCGLNEMGKMNEKPVHTATIAIAATAAGPVQRRKLTRVKLRGVVLPFKKVEESKGTAAALTLPHQEVSTAVVDEPNAGISKTTKGTKFIMFFLYKKLSSVIFATYIP